MCLNQEIVEIKELNIFNKCILITKIICFQWKQLIFNGNIPFSVEILPFQKKYSIFSGNIPIEWKYSIISRNIPFLWKFALFSGNIPFSVEISPF